MRMSTFEWRAWRQGCLDALPSVKKTLTCPKSEPPAPSRKRAWFEVARTDERAVTTRPPPIALALPQSPCLAGPSCSLGLAASNGLQTSRVLDRRKRAGQGPHRLPPGDGFGQRHRRQPERHRVQRDEPISDTATGALNGLESRAQGSPLAAGVVAFGAGMLISALIPVNATTSTRTS
jgi:hypothetical protein